MGQICKFSAKTTKIPEKPANYSEGRKSQSELVLRNHAWENNGADGGGRTHTLSRVPDFESGASASSATSATMRQYISADGKVNKFQRV